MAVTWEKLAWEKDVVTKALYTAAGSLITSSAAGTPVELVAGTNGYVLQIDTGTPVWANPAGFAVANHATTHKNGGTDEILLHELGEPTSAVDFDGQEGQNFVVHTVANAAARPTAKVGKMIFQSDELAFYGCTSDA